MLLSFLVVFRESWGEGLILEEDSATVFRRILHYNLLRTNPLIFRVVATTGIARRIRWAIGEVGRGEALGVGAWPKA